VLHLVSHRRFCVKFIDSKSWKSMCSIDNRQVFCVTELQGLFFSSMLL
jgi:hypothetical protein